MRKITFALPIFLIIYLVQEAIVNQFHFPAGGFSLLLIFTLVWAIVSTSEIAILGGFVAGVLMDLSQSSSGPIGQWTLLMIAACYLVSYIGFGNENVSGNPLFITLITTSAVFLVELAYVVTGALLGVAPGSIGQILITLFGISLWSLVATPILLPLFLRLHALIYSTRSTI